VSLQIHGGIEVSEFLASSENVLLWEASNGQYVFQEYVTGNTATLINPIVAGTFQYQPFEVTRISIDANRTVGATYLQGQVTETSDVVATIDQRLLKVLYLDLSGGYTHVKYIFTVVGVPGRSDDFFFYNASLETRFLKRGTAAVTYRYTHNASTESEYSLASHQVAFELSYRF
jgi:hypothetical protein